MCLRCRRAISRRSAVPVAGDDLRRSAKGGRRGLSQFSRRDCRVTTVGNLTNSCSISNGVLQAGKGAECPDAAASK